jgi:hypothetical protein
MKNILSLLLLCLFFACGADAKVENEKPNSGKVVAPAPKTVKVKSGANSVGGGGVVREGQGAGTNGKPTGNDLNGDGEPDRIDVITTTEENDGLGFKRQLVVYSGEGADLDAWYTADDVILSTQHGGMMGDPLESAEIEDGTIVIKHFGGSRTKWSYTHRFRWQNDDFKLIGTTVENDDPCNESTKLDYDLSTNIAQYATTTQKCEGDKAMDMETVTVNFSATVFPQSMNGFKTGENELKADGMTNAIFF